MRGDSGVAGEGRVVGDPKFHSWGKYTMPLTNINSDWIWCINMQISRNHPKDPFPIKWPKYQILHFFTHACRTHDK